MPGIIAGSFCQSEREDIANRQHREEARDKKKRRWEGDREEGWSGAGPIEFKGI